MKVRKETVIGAIVFIILACGSVAVFTYKKTSERSTLAKRIAELSPKGGPPQGLDDLKKAIALYEEQIEAYVKAAAQTGVYWKILATRLQDRGLWSEAFRALEKALEYTPEDASLHYQLGVCAGILGKDSHDFTLTGDTGERDRYYALAEEAYLRAIAMDERYTRPRYALAVLYTYELGRPEEAIPHLLRYREIMTRDTDALFVLAAAYYLTGQYESAVTQYDRILSLTKDPVRREQAEKNKKEILNRAYE
jgi:tetratricopeptide (TPR) repeat protein